MTSEKISGTENTIGAPFLLTVRQAAKALLVCEKTLWNITKRGDLPRVKMGRAVRYDVRDLQAYIDRQKVA